jgi:hypothetical protein
MIFVFGSNSAGRHGKGAALTARQDFGAEYGVGAGRTGGAYAIPTKSKYLEVLTIDIIEYHVDRFIEYANNHPELEFFVTRVGCGLAGYKDNEIAPLFKNVPKNCKLAKEWNEINS